MKEHYMRADKWIVVGLWVVIAKFVGWTIVAALVGWIGPDAVRLALVVLCPLSALTSVLHVRLYAVRMCSMIRATAGAHARAEESVVHLRR